MQSDDPCVEHAGCLLPNGYGKVGRLGKTWLAHRWAWHSKCGPIPEGLHVLHKCDNRKCINVAHLFLGTRVDNMQDMIAKGRHKFVGLSSPNYRPPEPLKGEKNGMAKLTEADVREMRKLFERREANTVELAEKFGIRRCHAYRIVNRKNWRHVDL